MNNNTTCSDTTLLLRQHAEDVLQKELEPSTSGHSEVETLKLIHELAVYRIELEMQNEELVMAKDKAERTAEKLSALYDFAPLGYFTLSREGFILELNLYGAKMLGKDRFYLISNLLELFISDDTKPAYTQFLLKTFKGQSKECCEVLLVGNGNSTPVYLIGIASENGEECFLTAVDITDRKRLEQVSLNHEHQLQLNQKLESLGVLAGGIAHDFNNLMGGVFGYINHARDESTDDKTIEYLSNAMATIDRARGLTRQLLTFATGGYPVRKARHLFPFIQETTLFALSGTPVSCNFDIPHNLWSCNFDKDQMGQVIDNIIINAQQAMPFGGTIDVTARNLKNSENEHPKIAKGNYIKISVKDYGTGISKERIPCIFDPFFTTKKTGHGLGLATCYSIVKRHDGCIDVESEMGKGSTFTIYLPASTDSVLPAREKRISTHKGSGTFLVMDDEEVIQQTVKMMLTIFGYTVICKSNGKEAVEFIKSEFNELRPVSGMIFDLTIPGGMGGKAAIEEIRKLDNDVPAFVTSGYPGDLVMINPSGFGFSASICKPFTQYELSELLNKHLSAVAV